jgi:hypothetical protein
LQTADKVAVEVLEQPVDGDVRTAAVAAAVIPPGRQEDATLNLPAQRLIKSAAATVDGQVGSPRWHGAQTAAAIAAAWAVLLTNCNEVSCSVGLKKIWRPLRRFLPLCEDD